MEGPRHQHLHQEWQEPLEEHLHLALCDEGSHLHQLHQVKIYSPNDTQAKYKEQSATNVPLRSTGTHGAPSKFQAGRESMGVSRERCLTVAAFWAECTCEVAVDAAQDARAVL